MWLGGMKVKGIMRWESSGTGLSWVATNWGIVGGNPDGDGECLQMWRAVPGGIWNDLPCGNQYPQATMCEALFACN